MLKKLRFVSSCITISSPCWPPTTQRNQRFQPMGKMLFHFLRPVLAVVVLHALLLERARPSRANPTPANDNA